MQTYNVMAFALKHEAATNVNRFQRKNVLTHCKYHGHTIGKCYKLHRKPLGFKQRQKHQVGSHTFAMVNQISTSSSLDNKNDEENTSIANFFQHLDDTRCYQLMTLLSNHMTSNLKTDDQTSSTPMAYNTGFYQSCTFIINHLASCFRCFQAYFLECKRVL